ncbi:4128_t:CDS:2 [Funneliformis mosseae]|uniref:4128_t:CDS:1 n=1 Tax=Funneliformis mosseae TaxID=27381 RepID=A0A9N9B8S1_FUNMO|nr:4128_t:CDS:2 [Funneliformis mosseae]
MNNMNLTINAGEIISKFRKLIVKIKSLLQCKEKFAHHAEAANLKEHNLILDVRIQ